MQVQKWGNSFAPRIPKPFTEEADVESGAGGGGIRYGVPVIRGAVSGDFYFETFAEGAGDLFQCREFDILCMIFDSGNRSLFRLQLPCQFFLGEPC